MVPHQRSAMKEVFRSIAEEWFLTEPLLFSVFCSHQLKAVSQGDSTITSVLRCGKGRIEYNPESVAKLKREEVREYLRIEMIRILLKHPYQRQPAPLRRDVCYWASDMVIQDHYAPSVRIFSRNDFPGIDFPGYAAAFEEYYRYLLPLGQSYSGFSDEHSGGGDHDSENDNPDQKRQEDRQKRPSSSGSGDGEENRQDNPRSDHGNEEGNTAASHARQTMPTGGGKGENEPVRRMTALRQMQEKAGQAAELWQEDSLMQEEINRFIEIAEQTQSWGSLKGRMREMIMASTVCRVDCSRLLNGFRGSLIASTRQLTRMRPSRRYGFENMGSRHKFSTRLLVAVDVSGSVPSDSIKQFFGLINRFFKYGIEKIDVIQFDSEIKGDILDMKRAVKEVKIVGRSGTNYQPVMDFLCQDGQYDGAVICTDGFAPIPHLKRNIKTKILWLFNNRAFYEKHTWIKHLPNSRSAFLE